MTDEFSELKALAPDVEPASQPATATGRAALAIAIAAERNGARRSALDARPWQRPGQRGFRQRAWWALLVAGVLGAAAVIGVVDTGGPGEPESAAAAELSRLAVVAAGQPPSAPRAGEYLYVRWVSNSAAINDSCLMNTPGSSEIWISANGSGLERDTNLRPTLFNPGQSRACAAALRAQHSTVGKSETVFAPGCRALGPTDLQRLPTNPASLRADLTARRIENGPPGRGEDFRQVGDLLRETDAPPALRSALYRVASTLPGVRLLGRVRDHAGRTGLGLAVDDRGLRSELIFDPKTAALLGEQQTVVSARSGFPVPKGTVIGWSVYLRSVIVTALPAGTPVGLRPPCGAGGAGTAHQSGARLTIVTGQ